MATQRSAVRKVVAGACAGVLAATGGAVLAREASGNETHLATLARFGRAVEAQVGPDRERLLSGGWLRLLEVGRRFDGFSARDLAARERDALTALRPLAPGAPAPGQVNDPYAAEDFASRMTGMTQNETSVAWCGAHVAVGYNDSGSFIGTAFLGSSPNGNLSFMGWSRSTDAGRTYADRGALFAAVTPAGIEHRDLFGDPVLACTSNSTFYYASLSTDTFAGGDGATGIAVSRSTDGAASFPRTVVAVSKRLKQGHLLDKPWLAVSPGSRPGSADDVLHVTYTDFDQSGTSATCGPDRGRTAIEYVRSSDGGQSWTAPAVVAESCDVEVLQGSQVEVGVGGDVFVAWQRFLSFPNESEIRVRRSPDRGQSWQPVRVVDRVTSVGAGFAVQGNFRAFIALQGLAVDTSHTRSRGTVYVTWHDGRLRSQPDPFGSCNGPSYCFGDALLSRSTDRGSTWSGPVRVNTDDPRRGIDQLFPALDVDRDGAVWVGFYDRRRDPRNFLLDLEVARSRDHGRTWTNRLATTTPFAPVLGGQDVFVFPLYIGDYLAIAADRLGNRPGVITAWGDNTRGDANVLARRFAR